MHEFPDEVPSLMAVRFREKWVVAHEGIAFGQPEQNGLDILQWLRGHSNIPKLSNGICHLHHVAPAASPSTPRQTRMERDRAFQLRLLRRRKASSSTQDELDKKYPHFRDIGWLMLVIIADDKASDVPWPQPIFETAPDFNPRVKFSYVIDLDESCFEVYSGFRDRSASPSPNQGEGSLVRQQDSPYPDTKEVPSLAGSWPLDALPDRATFLAVFSIR